MLKITFKKIFAGHRVLQTVVDVLQHTLEPLFVSFLPFFVNIARQNDVLLPFVVERDERIVLAWDILDDMPFGKVDERLSEGRHVALAVFRHILLPNVLRLGEDARTVPHQCVENPLGQWREVDGIQIFAVDHNLDAWRAVGFLVVDDVTCQMKQLQGVVGLQNGQFVDFAELEQREGKVWLSPLPMPTWK